MGEVVNRQQIRHEPAVPARRRGRPAVPQSLVSWLNVDPVRPTRPPWLPGRGPAHGQASRAAWTTSPKAGWPGAAEAAE
jgi:hypothetical protein